MSIPSDRKGLVELLRRLGRPTGRALGRSTRRSWDRHGYPSWRLLRPRSPWAILIPAIRIDGWIIASVALSGAVLVIFGWLLLRPLHLERFDQVLDEPAYTFFSDITGPRPGPDSPNACASRVPGTPPSPDAVIGTSGASRPDAFDMIACARADFEATRLNGAPGQAWGTSRNIIDALVAQEDRDFWTRKGVNFFELLRAASAIGNNRGGSNIPMQIIKNLNGEVHHTSWNRNLYERTHQRELDKYLTARLARQAGVRESAIRPGDLKAAILSLYLQTAYRDRPPPPDDGDAERIDCHVESTSFPTPKCLELLGAARQARHFYGKRLDQLTIAEAASVVADLRGGRYRIDAPENKHRESCAALRQELAAGPAATFKKTGGIYNNRCQAEHTIRVMANDPAVLKSEGWLDQFRHGPIYIPADQLPESMRAEKVPFITPTQESGAIAELQRLAWCGGASAQGLDIESRQLWCDVAGNHQAIKNLTAQYIAWISRNLPHVATDRPGGARESFAVYTTLDPVAQRAAVAALADWRLGGAGASVSNMPPPTDMALVTLGADGEVKALVGQAAAGRGGLPGSTLKPIILATYLQGVQNSRGAAAAASAFEAPVWANDCEGIPTPYVEGIGWPKATMDSCSKPKGHSLAWLPRNSEANEIGFFGGCNVNRAQTLTHGSLHEALCRSLNTVTAEVAIRLTRGPIAESMRKLGLRFINDKQQAGGFPEAGWNQSVIGEGAYTVRPLDLATGYTAFLNEGRVAPPVGIRHVVAIAQGRDAPAFEVPISAPERALVFSPEVVRLIHQGLLDVVAGINGTAHNIQTKDFSIAGKTGTSQGDGIHKPKDVWFVGYLKGNRPEVTVIWLSYSYPQHKSGFPANVGSISRLYGKDVATIYLNYLEKRKTALQEDAQVRGVP